MAVGRGAHHVAERGRAERADLGAVERGRGPGDVRERTGRVEDVLDRDAMDICMFKQSILAGQAILRDF